MRGRALPCLGLGLAFVGEVDADDLDADDLYVLSEREELRLAFDAFSAAFAEPVIGFDELGLDGGGLSAGLSPTETVRLAGSLPVSAWGGSAPPPAPVP